MINTINEFEFIFRTMIPKEKEKLNMNKLNEQTINDDHMNGQK